MSLVDWAQDQREIQSVSEDVGNFSGKRIAISTNSARSFEATFTTK